MNNKGVKTKGCFRQGENTPFRHPNHTLNTCGDGSSFIPTENKSREITLMSRLNSCEEDLIECYFRWQLYLSPSLL